MNTINLVKPNRNHDSATLMQVAAVLRERAGIEDAVLMMGTAPNKEMLAKAGLLAAEGEAAGPDDLIIALRGAEDSLNAIETEIEALLHVVASLSALSTQYSALSTQPSAPLTDDNLVLVSTQGIEAVAEAREALAQNRHVIIFSDNVSIEDEHALKAEAAGRGLLVMGPDFGTTIIGGVPFGFANAARSGSVGVVGASGDAMQEIISLVDRYGGGISHAIGVGNRDISEQIGGEMTVAAMKALLGDPLTEVVVVVSKPPHPKAVERVLQELRGVKKTVILAFLFMDLLEMPSGVPPNRVWQADTLEEAALMAVQSLDIEIPEGVDATLGPVEEAIASLAPRQRYVRGLFSGSAFCYEAMFILRDVLGPIFSNTPLSPGWELPDKGTSNQHTCLDMSAGEFTVGRPHPMIDQSARIERLISEAADEEVAVILLDVVLGSGAHPDPAGELAAAVSTAREQVEAQGRPMPVIIASVCGTENDPQGLTAQRRKLLDAGVIVAPSNSAAAGLATSIADRK